MQYNGVQIDNTPNNIIITDSDANQVIVTQPLTNVIEVITPGPKGSTGATGATGPMPPTGAFAVTGSNTFVGSQIITGSLVVTGSVQGNVAALTVTSNTASVDLSLASFYTLQLVSGSNIFINPSNIKPGLTATILVSTTGSGTVSFPSTVKQPSGSSYTPTTSTGKDVLTFLSYDTTTLYVASVKNLI